MGPMDTIMRDSYAKAQREIAIPLKTIEAVTEVKKELESLRSEIKESKPSARYQNAVLWGTVIGAFAALVGAVAGVVALCR